MRTSCNTRILLVHVCQQEIPKNERFVTETTILSDSGTFAQTLPAGLSIPERIYNHSAILSLQAADSPSPSSQTRVYGQSLAGIASMA